MGCKISGKDKAVDQKDNSAKTKHKTNGTDTWKLLTEKKDNRSQSMIMVVAYTKSGKQCRKEESGVSVARTDLGHNRRYSCQYGGVGVAN